MVPALSPEALLAVQDATKSAFKGFEFKAVTGEGTGRLVSGSVRQREVASHLTGRSVIAAEAYGLFRTEGSDELAPDRELQVQWLNGVVHIVSLDSGEILHGEGEPEIVSRRILRALGATTAE